MASTFDQTFWDKYEHGVYDSIIASGNSFDGKTGMFTFEGKRTYLQVLGDSEVSEVPVGAGMTATQYSEMEHSVRSVGRRKYRSTHYINQDDVELSLQNPESDYIRKMGAALARSKDISFIKSIFEDATEGEETFTSVPFDYTNQVLDVGLGGTGPTGLNIDKLVALRAKFTKLGYGRDSTIYLAITGSQESDLLLNTTATSGDFNNKLPMVDGVFTGFMGIEFVPCERIPYLLDDGTANISDVTGWNAKHVALDADSTDTRACFAWVKDVMKASNNPGLQVEADKDPAHDFNWVAQARLACSNIRMEEKGVILVPCLEA